jgi:ABC-type antimicrobial peptide transport system permease subunit
MEEVLSTSIAFQKFLMILMSVFAGLALALAAVGIYGVTAYVVAQRTHEIGVRIALGALRSDVLKIVLRRGMLLTLGGIVAGLSGAMALTRFLAGQLYGIKPTDPPVLVMVVSALGLIAFLASWMPARRATRVDPIVALRYE